MYLKRKERESKLRVRFSLQFNRNSLSKTINSFRHEFILMPLILSTLKKEERISKPADCNISEISKNSFSLKKKVNLLY